VGANIAIYSLEKLLRYPATPEARSQRYGHDRGAISALNGHKIRSDMGWVDFGGFDRVVLKRL
jgi:hypothetical protein